MSEVDVGWRQPFTSTEANRLHALAFNTRRYSDAEWDWVSQLNDHSLGWVTARIEGGLLYLQ